MSKNNIKNYNNFNNYNREQRRQLERQQRRQKEFVEDVKITKVNGFARVDVQEDSELPCEIGYGDNWYKINTGYLTLVSIAKLEEERVRKQAKGNFDGLEALGYFDNVLRAVFADGEYDRFFTENPNVSFEGIREIANAMTHLISTDKSQLIEEAEDANADTSFRKRSGI